MKGNTLNFEMRSELVRNLDVLSIYSRKFSVRGLFECHFPTLSVVTRSSVSRCGQVVHMDSNHAMMPSLIMPTLISLVAYTTNTQREWQERGVNGTSIGRLGSIKIMLSPC